jgi:hypothetical protein
LMNLEVVMATGSGSGWGSTGAFNGTDDPGGCATAVRPTLPEEARA